MTQSTIISTVSTGQDNSYCIKEDRRLSGFILPGLSLSAGDVAARLTAIVEAGDAANQLSGWTLVGENFTNTDDGYLYWGLTDSGGDRTVSLYKDSGAAAANLVAQGTRTGDGAITLTAQNSSGLTGTVTVAYSGDDVTYTANILTTALINAQKYDASAIATTQIPFGVVEEYNNTTGAITYTQGEYNFTSLGITSVTGYEDVAREELRQNGIYTN